MPAVREIQLVDVSISHDATFAEAAVALCHSGVAAIAVVDGEQRVVGAFTSDDLLRGLYPRYLGEMRHTAFLKEGSDSLEVALDHSGADPVADHMQDPQTVDIDAGGAHVAERFLHLEASALAVVEDDRFRGMLDQVAFARGAVERTKGS